jgi:hypothetical protein
MMEAHCDLLFGDVGVRKIIYAMNAIEALNACGGPCAPEAISLTTRR